MDSYSNDALSGRLGLRRRNGIGWWQSRAMPRMSPNWLLTKNLTGSNQSHKQQGNVVSGFHSSGFEVGIKIDVGVKKDSKIPQVSASLLNERTD